MEKESLIRFELKNRELKNKQKIESFSCHSDEIN